MEEVEKTITKNNKTYSLYHTYKLENQESAKKRIKELKIIMPEHLFKINGNKIHRYHREYKFKQIELF